MTHQYSPLEDKLKNYTVNGECWEYNGRANNYGYCLFMSNKKLKYAHRWSYEFYKGKIPDGMTVDHICFNRKCINPDHLRLITHSENSKRHQFSQKLELCKICGREKEYSCSGKTYYCKECARRRSMKYRTHVRELKRKEKILQKSV